MIVFLFGVFYVLFRCFKVIIECAFDSLMSSSSHRDSVSMQNGSCATEGVYSSLAAMIFYSLWTMYKLNLNLQAMRGVWDVFCEYSQYLKVIWLSDRRIVGTDVQRKCDRESIRSAAWNCSGLFRQSTINPYQLDRMHLFSIRRQQTAPEYLLQTSQMNELDWTLLPQCSLWIWALNWGKISPEDVARMLNWSE